MRLLPGAWLEPVLQELRIWKIQPHLPQQGDLVDVGCDEPQVLLNKVCKNMHSCIGLDIVVQKGKRANIHILRQDLQQRIELPNESADVVTFLAVLEHMKHPKEMIQEAFRILRPGGLLLVTVPSPASKPILEFFAKISLVRKEMVDQHENYFTLDALRAMSESSGFKDVYVEHWEFGFNTFLKAVK